MDKYGGTLKMDIYPSGYNFKNAMNRIKDDSFIKEIYYPGVETSTPNLSNLLQLEYIHNNEIIKEGESKTPVSYIGLDLDSLEYSGEEFDFIEGRIFENDNECVINRGSISQYAWSFLDVGDKIILGGIDEDIELTICGIVNRENILGFETNGQLLYTTTENIVELATRYQDPEKICDPDAILAEPNNPFSITNINYINGREDYGYKCVVILKDYRLFVPFQQYLESINTFKQPTLYANPFYDYDENILAVARSTDYMSMVFLTIIVFMIIVTTVTTSIMYLSNRKYEFAVLCSVGMNKPQIMGSYIFETLSFMFFTSLAAIGIGQLIFLFGFSDMVKSAFEGWIDTSLPITNILLVNGAAVLAGMVIIVAVTVLISMIYMLSFEPLKIFNKRYS